VCVLPGAPGLDFETWESIDIDEITPTRRATLYSCSSTFSQGTHHKLRVGGDDDKKRARSGFRLATPRLPMTNCIHRQTKTIRESPLAQAQALTETSHVHGFRQSDLVTLALIRVNSDRRSRQAATPSGGTSLVDIPRLRSVTRHAVSSRQSHESAARLFASYCI
jgi:hypothetical protein